MTVQPFFLYGAIQQSCLHLSASTAAVLRDAPSGPRSDWVKMEEMKDGYTA
jgi:hypothetical protein